MEKANNNRNRRGRTINIRDETTSELRESDTDEEYIEIAIEEYRSVQPKQQEPVIVPDENNDRETSNGDADLMDVRQEDGEAQEIEGLHNNEVLNENILAQKEAARNDDQLPNDENIADPRERLQRIRQQGYLAGGNRGEFPPKIRNSHPHLKKLNFWGETFPPRSDL